VADYTPVGSVKTVRVLSQTQVVDVESIAIYTKPSNIYLEVQVPLTDFNAGNADTYLETTADLVEGVLAASPDPGQTLASGCVYVQDIDSSGLLAAFLDFTVSYIPQSTIALPFSTTVRLPLTSFETADAFGAALPGGTPLAILEAAYAQVKKLAGG
jgi:hypothetical protein